MVDIKQNKMTGKNPNTSAVTKEKNKLLLKRWTYFLKLL